MRRGLVLVALGLAIYPTWFFLTDLINPNPTGLEIKDGAVLSAIPFLLGVALVGWGLVCLWRAWSAMKRRLRRS